MMTVTTFVIIGISLCLILLAFFSGYEIAFISTNRLNVELKKKQGKPNGKIVSKFLDNPATFIGTCLVGMNLFLVGYGLLFDQLLSLTLWNPLHIVNQSMKLLFNTLITALVVLIFGEFLPKAIFRAKADNLVLYFAHIANFFHQLFLPITSFFVGIAKWVLTYLFNLKINKSNAFNKMELDHFFPKVQENELDKHELNTDLFENALSLPGIKIRQCLVPRTEIEAVDINASIESVTARFIKTKLSKLIVYNTNLDNILGYIHQLDMFKKPTSLVDIIHPIPVIPETMGVTDLINKFTEERKSIAWVVDEFGGTAGVITMEDVLEEIFGEIQDEYDTEEFVDKQLSEDEFIFSGRLELDFIIQKYNLEFDAQHSETLSGYIINDMGTIPKQNQEMVIENYQFTIMTVSDTRIEMVKMKILR